MNKLIISSSSVLSSKYCSGCDAYAPEKLAELIRYAESTVIIEPRFLGDDELAYLRNTPTLYIIDNPVDIMHLKMHLEQGRLVMTPYDRFFVSDANKGYLKSNPWILPFIINEEDITSFNMSGSELSVPREFRTLPKSVYIEIARIVMESSIAPYNHTVVYDDRCKSLVGSVISLTDVIFSEYENLKPDLAIVESENFRSVLSKFSSISFLVCPFISRKNFSIEALVHRLIMATKRTVSLINVDLVYALPDDEIVCCATFEIG